MPRQKKSSFHLKRTKSRKTFISHLCNYFLTLSGQHSFFGTCAQCRKHHASPKNTPPPSMNCSHSLNIKVKICQNGLLEECARCTQILKEGLILQRQSIILVFYQLAEELANFCGTSVLRYTTVESVVLSGTECSSPPKFQLSPNFPQGSILHLFYYPTSKAI